MNTFRILSIATLLAVGACKRDDVPSPAIEQPAQPAASKQVEVPSGAPAASSAEGKSVDFKKFATDMMTVAELESVYPAGVTFTMKAILKSDPTCDTDCSIELSDGAKTFMKKSVDAANKAKLDDKKAGAEVVLACTPVYAGGMLQFAQSCHVQ